MKEQKFEFSAKNTFFTSDSHWNHSRIIELCKRPFKDVEEMNNSLIENWNKVVPKDGTVFHLGDFAFGGSSIWNDILDQLNGKIYLILGNHYPFLCYGGSYRNDADAVWQLFGHVHSGPASSGLDCDRLVHLFPYQYDVDNNSYTPISWEEVKKKIQHQIDGRGTISYKVYKLND